MPEERQIPFPGLSFSKRFPLDSTMQRSGSRGLSASITWQAYHGVAKNVDDLWRPSSALAQDG